MMLTFTPLGVGAENSCSRSGYCAGQRVKIGWLTVTSCLLHNELRQGIVESSAWICAESITNDPKGDDDQRGETARLPESSPPNADDSFLRRAVAGVVAAVSVRIACTEDSEQGGDEGKYPISEGDLR